ncbi:MAG: type II toxin-antitoxin system VapC family toxin [Rhodospirillales bacterium]
MSVVLDASVTLAWYFEDEASPATDELLNRIAEAGAVVPPLWRFEVGNGLQMAIRRQRITAAYRNDALVELAAMPITIDADSDVQAWTSTLRLSERFSLTLYDATYLELAHRRALPLATLDRALQAAAQDLGLGVA